MTVELLNLALLLILGAMLLRIMSTQRKAARIARDTKSEAARAAADAAQAASTARAILDRLETGGGRTLEAAHRIEDAAGVVADDLQAQHDRADAVTSTEPGAAADAAATSPPRDVE